MSIHQLDIIMMSTYHIIYDLVLLHFHMIGLEEMSSFCENLMLCQCIVDWKWYIVEREKREEGRKRSVYYFNQADYSYWFLGFVWLPLSENKMKIVINAQKYYRYTSASDSESSVICSSIFLQLLIWVSVFSKDTFFASPTLFLW